MRSSAFRLLACGLLPWLLGGCGTAPVPGKPPVVAAPTPPSRPADVRPATGAGPLKAERQWLQAWFRGTPVVIAERDEGAAVSVEVPRAFCFDAGRSEPKPALAAVLDKVAESLRRVPTARLTLIAAPDDGGSAAPALAQERAARVQRHLQSRGVAAARLGKPTGSGSAGVALRLEATPPLP